jgi:hypothetical protein
MHAMRFISRDSFENAELSQGMNLYQYFQNNSVNAIESLRLFENFIGHYMPGSGTPMTVPMSGFDLGWTNSDFSEFSSLTILACWSQSDQSVALVRTYDAGSAEPGVGFHLLSDVSMYVSSH